MDLSVFLEPISEEVRQLREHLELSAWGRNIQAYAQEFPAWQYADIILIGCRECRGGEQPGMEMAASAIRQQLYALSMPVEEMKVADLGNLQSKSSPEAYYEAMAYVLNELFEAQKTVVLLGGSQDLTLGQIMGLQEREEAIEYVHVDSRFDWQDADISLNQRSYNDYLFRQFQSQLFQYTNLGYQSYFVSREKWRELRDRSFCLVRYGDLHAQIEEAEPSLRMAHLMSFDLSSVRHSDAPASIFPSPGGFSAFEACRLARYAGLGYRLRSILLSEFDPTKDTRGQSALLLAMMVWYFTEGYYNRKEDFPLPDRSNLKKYSVRLHASVRYIDFFHHPGSGRWWMEVPYQESLAEPKRHNRLIPCSKKDYEFAQTDDIPERWWRAFGRLKE